MKGPLSRRTLLKGAGASLALPLLDAMTHGAWGQTAPVKRFVLFTISNGLLMSRYTPTASGANWEITPILEPLRSRKSAISLVTGLTNMANIQSEYFTFNVNHHPLCMSQLLTGGVAPVYGPLAQPDAQQGDTKWVKSFGGPTVDQVIADAVGGATQVPSLSVYCELNRTSSTPNHRYCWKGVDQPVTPWGNPRELFDFLFGGIAGDPGAAARQQRRRRSVIDAVKESTASLKPQLGRGDRARLDLHLEALRELEKRVNTVTTCTKPADPGPASMWDPASMVRQRTEVMLQLSTMALKCDLSRVLVFSMGGSADGVDIQWMGLPNNDHGFSHWLPSKPEEKEGYAQVSTWKMMQLARFLELLESTQEGAGSLLDASMLIATSEFSEGGLHMPEMIPVLLAGGVGGLRKGLHHVVPCTVSSRMAEPAPHLKTFETSGTTPMANFWLTALNTFGVPATQFGVSTGTVSGLWG